MSKKLKKASEDILTKLENSGKARKKRRIRERADIIFSVDLNSNNL